MVAVRVLSASVARMINAPGPSSGVLGTQRILLFLFGSGGECRAFFGLQRMATMLPEAPVTCGMATSDGVNPARAQVGSEDTGGCPTHPLEAAPRGGWPALAGTELTAAGAGATESEARAADCALCPVQAARRDATATRGTKRTRYPIAGQYAPLSRQ